jgi:RimJ/RimL family protein N-acetyltransferase
LTVEQVRTERLILRRWRQDDREPFAALNRDPIAMEHLPSVLSREESAALADRIEAHFMPAIEIGWRLDRASGVADWQRRQPERPRPTDSVVLA